MNTPTIPPGPDPEDTNHHPPTDNAVHGFPPPINPCVMISQLDAIQRALHEAGRYGENNPEDIRSRLMRYQEALQLAPNSLLAEEYDGEEYDGFTNIPVLLVEMTGVFRVRSWPGWVVASTQPYTKAHFILSAANGSVLQTCLFTEQSKSSKWLFPSSTLQWFRNLFARWG